MEVIKVDKLTKDYGGNRGVFDLSLVAKEGEIIGFLGPNGAGKTTTIRHLMGFLKPEHGECHIKGFDCWREQDKIQKDLGYLPGEIGFMDNMTGKAFLNFLSEYRKDKHSNRKEELIKLFQLEENIKIKKMSKGMKQKLGIVAAFMHDPEILILDEPTSGLDPLMQNLFVEMLIKEKEKGKTILMSSHIFEEVERTCDKVCIIKDGKLVAFDTVAMLKEQQVKRYEITFTSQGEARDFIKKDFKVLSCLNNKVNIELTGDVNQFIKDLGEYKINSLITLNQSLEEVFMQYYGGEKNV